MRLLVAGLLSLLVRAEPVRVARAPHGMVAAEHRLAAEAGIRILQRGGNAVDAAVATALAVGVVNPASCGIGGGGFMLVFERRSGTVAAVDYREVAPAAATREMFIRDGRAVAELSLTGGLAVAVPGEVAGLVAALRRFGTMPLADVAAPAIAYARDGFPIEQHLADAIANQRGRLGTHPALAALFLHPDGRPRASGEILQQSDLARTLERIVREGPEVLYGGALGNAVARSVRAAGGILQLDDLAAYRAIWRRPLRGRFAGYEIYGMPPPSSGGGALLQILRTVHRDDLAALEHNSPTYLHLLAEAMQFAFADRAAYYGDPGYVDVPLVRLLAPERAHRLRRCLSAATTFSQSFYGTGTVPADQGTSHLSVIDGDGNAVACTTSINTAFGSALAAEGIILNNTMGDFAAQPETPNVYGLIGSDANAIAPGKRPLSSMAPTIAIRGGRAAAVAGGSGGPFIISATTQALLNVLVFGYDAATAVAAPRVHHQWLPPVLMVEAGIDAGVQTALRRIGHRPIAVAEMGAVQLVRRAADGWLDGAADPRKGGQAVGW